MISFRINFRRRYRSLSRGRAGASRRYWGAWSIARAAQWSLPYTANFLIGRISGYCISLSENNHVHVQIAHPPD